ncbi:MBL fold metallo-hydrolase [Paenibacillus brasilensis]|uniref:Glyoxylase-like metal-dependent hydrolase (Beta-lactamase superfamily II) n=1 Tax=Paenibacillus brasilensis TaxID=128574 RepID=A0ABU0KVF7_9BACL|nr:MBL fold metallo-hydrolase [Paenibacillus brasilensis]MDQ0492233.1 glyoxylase-like metal-dependent hydrolase (beta-lactamase superfamily II) [Paenibacillus brasilensis]
MWDINYEIYQLNTRSYRFSNFIYIIIDKTTRNALIVDPAWKLNIIVDKLNQLDAALQGILLTHSHYDHVNLVAPLEGLFNPYVYMSKAETDYYGFRCNNLQAINDQDKISVGETMVTCMHTPGHTAGGVSYLLKDSIFTGDTIFIEGCGICNSWGGLPEQSPEGTGRDGTLGAFKRKYI